jgi:hypothetical protein
MVFRVSFRLTSLSPLVINVWLEPFNPNKTALPMIATCIHNLTSALADMPTAAGMQIPPRSVLQGRLQALERVTICLRPGDTYRYRVLALLFRLPDLRPEARAALLHHLHSNLDFYIKKTESCDTPETESQPLPDSSPSTASPSLPQRKDPVPEAAAPEPSPPPEAGSFFSTTRREDLFDRFLSWIASLVS